MKKIIVIGINHNEYGMNRLVDKLHHSIHETNISFYQCGSSGWDLYHKVLKLYSDKIIIIDQFDDCGEEEISKINYITINERILIIGINSIFFGRKDLSCDLKSKLEQIIFQIRRLILKEISLDSCVQF
ncbi:MAG: hypothetical protein KAX49_17140 [Halanaerobiales bacterium]|nr:hypothetical protein [Halanaerobiales bacterium]